MRTKDVARSIGWVNGHDVLKAASQEIPGRLAYIDYIPTDNGRGGRSARVVVVGLGFSSDTSPNRHWSDHGHKTFDLFEYRHDRAAAVAAAAAWAEAEFGYGWKKITGFGSTLFPAPVADWATARLKAARKNLEA